MKRFQSAILGLQVDEVGFKKDIDRLVKNAKKMAAAEAAKKH